MISDTSMRRLVLLCSTMPLALAAAPAAAQDSAAEANASTDIVVTAQRRNESIQDVPIAITAIGAQQLKEQNVQGIDDVFAMAPNVSFQSNGSRDRKDLAIRGISNQLDPYSPVRQSSYAFYIDEFSVAAGTSNPQIVDLERIEVLRGPQGTYFGRNAVGGAINVITKKPVDRFEGEINLGYSSFDTKHVDGVLNVPVVPGLLAVRASGMYEKTDGYIRNVNAIGGGNDGRYYSGRIEARLTPADGLTWDFTYSNSNEKTGMRNGVPTGFVTRTWASTYYKTTAGLIGDEDGVGFFPQNDDEVNFDREQQVGTRFHFYSTRAAWDLGPVQLTGILGHLEATTYNYGDVDGGSHDYFYEDLNLKRKSTSGELRMQSTGSHFLDWSLGLMVGKDTGVMRQSTFHGAESPICPAAYNGNCEGLEATGNDADASSRYFAAFAQGTFNFTDTLSLVAGVRYSWEKTANDGVRRSNGIVNSTNDRSAAFEDVSPRFTLTYKPQPGLMIYATASRGFKAGGTQASGSTVLANSYKPETLWNYELGTKFDLFDGRVRFDLTGFYMDWKDVQQNIRFQSIVNGSLVSVTGIANAASARSYGVEGSFNATLLRGWTLGGQVGYNNARFRDYEGALIDGTVLDLSGEKLTNAPTWTLGAQTQYRAPVFADFDGFVRAEWNYRAATISNPYYYLYKNVAGEPFLAPSYHNVNARIGIDNDRMRLEFYVENLFDAHYYNSAYEKAFYSGVQVEPSFRNFGVTAGYKF